MYMLPFMGDDANVEMSIDHSHSRPSFYQGITTIIVYRLARLVL